MNLAIEAVAYLCECLTQLLCIHAFLGRKLKLNKKMIALIIMYITTLLVIINFNISGVWTFLTNIYFCIYILLGLKIEWVQGLVLLIVEFISAVSIQGIAVIPVYLMFTNIKNASIVGLIVNVIALVLMIGLIHWIKLNKIYIKIIKFDKLISRIIVLFLIIYVYLLLEAKMKNGVEIFAYTVSAILIGIMLLIIFKWQKDKYAIRQKNIELHMHELYGKTFEIMIDDMRIRQHNFKNQLSAIYALQLTIDDFDELVNKQKEYCNYLIEESRYDSILTKCNNRILAGFLYTKFIQAEQNHIKIEFEVLIVNKEFKVPTYKLIEIIGVLFDNAIEYVMEHHKEKQIYFSMKDSHDGIKIVCRNIATYIPMEQIGKFFKKGYSTKGDNRGLGLYDIKRQLEGIGHIFVENKNICDNEWIQFTVEINN